MNTQTVKNNRGQSLAYQQQEGTGPVIVFLAGHGSDMFGSKAEALSQHCVTTGHAFIRFDYAGHGMSEGEMMQETISSWTDDALTIIDKLTDGPVMLVGSSLGGWIMLNVALARPDRVAGCIGIAAAPDFTETLIWDQLLPEQQQKMAQEGQIALPNPYADEDVIYPYQLIVDGRTHLLLNKPLPITCPLILHQGMADHEVPWQTASQIALAAASEDVRINFVKSSGHRFSSDEEIAMLISSVDEMRQKIA